MIFDGVIRVSRNAYIMDLPMERRTFLVNTAVAAASASLAKGATSPNDTVRVAVVGMHGRGKSPVGIEAVEDIIADLDQALRA